MSEATEAGDVLPQGGEAEVKTNLLTKPEALDRTASGVDGKLEESSESVGFLTKELKRASATIDQVEEKIFSFKEQVFPEIDEQDQVAVFDGPFDSKETLRQTQELLDQEHLDEGQLTSSITIRDQLQTLIQEQQGELDRLEAIYTKEMRANQGLSNKISWEIENSRMPKPIKRFQKFWVEAQQNGLLHTIGLQEEVGGQQEETRVAMEKYNEQAVRVRELRQTKRQLVNKQKQEFLVWLEPQLMKIREASIEFADVMEIDGRVLDEFQGIFSKNVIEPEMIRILEQKENLTREERQAEARELLTDLHTFVENRGKSPDQDQELKANVERHWREGNLYEMQYWCSNFLQGMDKDIVRRLGTQIATDRFASIQERLQDEGLGDSYAIRKVFERAHKPLISYESGERVEPELLASLDVEKMSRESIGMWKQLMKSPTARAVFDKPDTIGEMMTSIDQRLYKSLLEGSLTDSEGHYIDGLQYYPTPDSIRNLILLAAADRKNYRTNHANTSLTALARDKEGWSQYLDATSQQYPELFGGESGNRLRNVLLDWNFTYQHNNHELQFTVDTFALSILQSQEKDGRILALARESLTNKGLFNELIKDEIFTQEESQQLGVALAYAEKLVEEHHRGYAFGNHMRSLAKIATSELSGEKNTQAAQRRLKQLLPLAEAINANANNQGFLEFYTNDAIVALNNLGGNVHDMEGLSPEDIDTIFQDKVALLAKAPELCPALLTQENRYESYVALADILTSNPEEFLTEDGLLFLQKLADTYGEHKQQRGLMANAYKDGHLTSERVIELAEVPGFFGKGYELAMQFPQTCLQTPEDVEFYKKILVGYHSSTDETALREAIEAATKSGLPKELALAIPQKSTALLLKENSPLRRYIFNNAEIMLQDSSDIQFYNVLIGEHGATAAHQIAKDYHECLKAEVITKSERETVLEFARHFRIITPKIIEGYKQAKQSGTETMYLANMRQVAEKLVGSQALTDEDRQSPYYQDLLRATYQNNAGQYGSLDVIKTHDDRLGDIAEFNISDRYEIDLMSAAKVSVKEGEVLDTAELQRLQDYVYDIFAEMKGDGFSQEVAQQRVVEELDKLLATSSKTNILGEIDLEKIASPEEKLFLLMTDHLYGGQQQYVGVLKKLVMKYEFAFVEDVRNYVEGTRDRVSHAQNQDYALLSELHNLFSDRIKEINRVFIQAGHENQEISKSMPKYFEAFARSASVARRQEIMNKQRIDKLGLSESFIDQIRRTLKGKSGRSYTNEQVAEIIQRYERLTGGLEQETTSLKGRTKAFFGQLRSQREKTFETLRKLSADAFDPATVHLGEINLAELIEQQAALAHGTYDEEQFANYTGQRMINLFSDELSSVETELDKFVSESGKSRQVLYGYITKNKESALARMVGGVCVSRDQKQWDTPEYFEFVFQDPETLRCQGLCLMHHYEEGGQKILTVSFNPSSTYLLSSDEAALFTGILGKLEEFAQKNDFDVIAVSSKSAIRTNRTGGVFEKTMEDRVRKVNKKLNFEEPKIFSYSPSYQIQEMDILWENPTQN